MKEDSNIYALNDFLSSMDKEDKDDEEMDKKQTIQTTLRLVVTPKSSPQNHVFVTVFVDNTVDEQGRIIEFHTRAVKFRGDGLTQKEQKDFEIDIRSYMDSNNPDAWAQFGNKRINK